jgi:hypothetical protein
LRRKSLWFGVLVLVVVFAAVVAPAMAKKEEVVQEFEASAAGKTKGEGSGTQEFKFKPYTIKCTEAPSSGEVTETKFKALVDKVKLGGCTYGRKAEAKVTPIEFEFLSNGTFKILNEVKFTLVASKCTIVIEPQTIGEEESRRKNVSYANEGGESGKKLEIKTNVKTTEHGESDGISYEFGKICEKFEEPSGEGGKYKGTLVDELEKGTLGIS